MAAVRRLIAAAAALALMAIGARLPFVPGWQRFPLGIILVGTLAALALVLGAARAVWRRASPRRGLEVAVVAAGGVAGTLFISWLVAGAVYGLTYLAGEELAETETIPGGGTMFVYVLSEIPDGCVGSRVAIREGWLPLERTLLTVGSCFRRALRDDSGLTLMFYGGQAARYTYAERRIELLEPP